MLPGRARIKSDSAGFIWKQIAVYGSAICRGVSSEAGCENETCWNNQTGVGSSGIDGRQVIYRRGVK